MTETTKLPTRHPLERDYLVLSMIILFILLNFCIFSGWHIYESEEKARFSTLKSRLQIVQGKFTTSIDSVGNFMQFIGERVVSMRNLTLASKVPLFEYNYSLDSNFQNLYSWTLLNWVDDKDKIRITSQEGLLERPAKVPDYYPVNAARTKPWALHLSEPRNSPDNYQVIPISMGITDNKDNYVGTIVSDIVVEKLARDLQNALKEEEIIYIILDDRLRPLISYPQIPQEYHFDKTQMNMEENADGHRLQTPIKINDITYNIIGRNRYPFTILIGYKNATANQQFKNELLPYVYSASGIAVVFLIILFLFRHYKILPLINSLRSNLELETASRLEKERFLASILARIPGFVYRHELKDQKINALFVSEGCKKLTGYSPEQYFDAQSIKHTDVIDPAYVSEVINSLQNAVKKFESFEISYPIRTADGQQKWVLNQGTPVEKTDKSIVFEGLLTDITDFKLVEQQMEIMVKELAASNKDLTRFAHICSHDLKEPLRTIYSYIELLKEENAHNQLSESSLLYLNFIATGALRLKQLIEDILLYSQVGAETLAMTDVDLEYVVSDVISSLNATISEKQAIIKSIDSLPHVLGNHTAIFRLFKNIISNALKFNDGTPHIRIHAQRNAAEYLIAIQDNGIGIPKEYHEQIFKLFERLHTKDEYPGTGLGLALCQRIVERHGGKIWIESQVGAGTSVYFTLPLL